MWIWRPKRFDPGEGRANYKVREMHTNRSISPPPVFSDDIAIGVNCATEGQTSLNMDSVTIEDYKKANQSLVATIIVKELFLIQINQNS